MIQIEPHNKIEKLEYYSSSDDGQYVIRHPNVDDIVDKINELIDILNGNGEPNDSNS